MLKLAERKQQRLSVAKEAPELLGDATRRAPELQPEPKKAKETTAVAAIVEHFAALGVKEAFE